jgi:hypothetical protein
VLAQGVASWVTAGVIPAYPEIGLRARVCVPIRWRGELLGLLLVTDAEGTLTTAELTQIVGCVLEGLDQAIATTDQAALAWSAACGLLPGPVVFWDELGAYASLLRIRSGAQTYQ